MVVGPRKAVIFFGKKRRLIVKTSTKFHLWFPAATWNSAARPSPRALGWRSGRAGATQTFLKRAKNNEGKF